MNTEYFLWQLKSYLSFDEEEEKNRIQTIAFLSNIHNTSKSHLTASAWIINKTNNKVLFTHHKKYNEWYPLGGHLEKEDELPFNAALREAKEESGLCTLLPLRKQGIFDISMHTGCNQNSKPDSHGEESKHFDITYCFQNQDHRIPQRNNESFELSWFSLEEKSLPQNIRTDQAICRCYKKWKQFF